MNRMITRLKLWHTRNTWRCWMLEGTGIFSLPQKDPKCWKGKNPTFQQKYLGVYFCPSSLILFTICYFSTSKISRSADLGALQPEESLACALLYTDHERRLGWLRVLENGDQTLLQGQNCFSEYKSQDCSVKPWFKRTFYDREVKESDDLTDKWGERWLWWYSAL